MKEEKTIICPHCQEVISLKGYRKSSGGVPKDDVNSIRALSETLGISKSTVCRCRRFKMTNDEIREKYKDWVK